MAERGEVSGQMGFRWPVGGILPAPDPRMPESRLFLNQRYTFSNFVVGPSNRLAHAAALACVQGPGAVYNPLFIHGAVGLGKTHLVQAICHAAIKKNSGMKIVYLSCESFVNDFISAMQSGTLENFRAYYRTVDMLIVDDIHFLAHKEGSQEEVFHTFNSLYNTERQIVLSSDSPPKDIPTLEERLVSRFKWGLVARIDAPSFETRVAILKNKALMLGRELPDKVAHYLAENIDSNVRELEGAVIKVTGLASVEKSEITIDTARTAVSDSAPRKEKQYKIEEIRDAVAEYFNVKASDLHARKRNKSIVVPRQICMYLARKLTDYSLEEIGGFMGGRDHSTVLYAEDKIAAKYKNSHEISVTIDEIVQSLKNG